MSISSNIYYFFMVKTYKTLSSSFLKCTEHYYYLQLPYCAMARQNFLFISNYNLYFGWGIRKMIYLECQHNENMVGQCQGSGDLISEFLSSFYLQARGKEGVLVQEMIGDETSRHLSSGLEQDIVKPSVCYACNHEVVISLYILKISFLLLSWCLQP